MNQRMFLTHRPNARRLLPRAQLERCRRVVEVADRVNAAHRAPPATYDGPELSEPRAMGAAVSALLMVGAVLLSVAAAR